MQTPEIVHLLAMRDAAKESMEAPRAKGRQIAVYGVGGHGREIASFIQNRMTVEKDDEFVGFIDDDLRTIDTTINGARVFSFEGLLSHNRHVSVVCGVGSPQLREKLVEKCEKVGLTFANIIYAGASIAPSVSLSDGVVVAPGVIMTTNIKIGRHVHLNIGCSIINDYAIVNPGARICGWVHLGKRSYIGAGATISNGQVSEPLVIGDDAVVGAGACVIRSVPAGMTVVGVPARPIRSTS
jgi:sugar O-acyltransferase (sialic acid O-acetyltransferase NeuD family)